MDYKDLPASRLVALSARDDMLAAALTSIFPGSGSFLYAPIYESPRSGRIFSRREFDDGVLVPGARTGTDLAEVLVGFTEQARYQDPNSDQVERGWEIREALLNSNTIAIAWAAYVPQ